MCTEFLIEFVPDRRLTFQIIIIIPFDTNLQYFCFFILQEVLEHTHCHGTAKVIAIQTEDTLHAFGSLKIHDAIVIYQHHNLIATLTIYKYVTFLVILFYVYKCSISSIFLVIFQRNEKLELYETSLC